MKNKICVGGFLTDGRRFLFGKRSGKKTWAPRLWDIAGGKALKNEHPLLALRRETFEEIAIEVTNAVLIRSLEITEPGKKNFTYLIYMITGYNGKPVNSSAEHSKIRWFTREELDSIDLALPEYTAMIDEWLTGNESRQENKLP